MTGAGRRRLRRFFRYLIDIENASLRNTIALFALIRATDPARSQRDLYYVVAELTRRIALLMDEQSIEDVRTIDPDELTYQVLQGQAGKALTDYRRTTVSKTWFRLRNTFEGYAERWSSAEADRMSTFLVQRITRRSRPATEFSLANYTRKQQDRVKAKIDEVHAHLQRPRFLSAAQLNQVRRFYEAAEAAVAKFTTNEQLLPYEFSYEETAFADRVARCGSAFGCGFGILWQPATGVWFWAVGPQSPPGVSVVGRRVPFALR